MIQSLRLFVAVGATVLAVAGCQKGAQSGADGDGGSKEVGSGSKSTQAEAKATKSGTRAADAPAGGSRAGGKGSTLTVADDGTAVDLRQGQVLTVVLASNPSAGLNWAMAEPTATIIVPEGKPMYAAGTGGSSGTETWHFRAARRGQQTVRLEYRRAWQQNVPERTFRFTATVR